jgi:hypothetical protein
MPFGQVDQPSLGIYGGGQSSPGMMNPMSTFSQMMNVQEQQALLQERQQQAQKLAQEQADDQAIRQTLQRHDRPDDAVDDLYHQGLVTAATKLGTGVYNQRKAALQDHELQLKDTNERLDTAGRMASSASDDASWGPVRPAIAQLLQPVYGNAINDVLPTRYDKAKVDALLRSSMTAQERNSKDQEALRLAADQPQKDWQNKDHWMQLSRQYLSQAADGNDWSKRIGDLHGMGAPDAVLSVLPKYDPANPAATMKALTGMTLTGEQATQAKQAEITEAGQVESRALARERLDFEEGKAKGGAPKPLTGNEEATLVTKRATAFDKADALVRNPNNKIAVRGDPTQTAPPAPTYRQQLPSWMPLSQTAPTQPAYQENLQKAIANAGDYPGKSPFWDLVKPDAREQYVNMRVNAENAYRTAHHQPELEEAAEQAIADKDPQAYAAIADQYKAVTKGLKLLSSEVPWPGAQGTPSAKDVRLPASAPAISRSATSGGATTPTTKADRDAQVIELQKQLKTATPLQLGKLQAEIMRLRALNLP